MSLAATSKKSSPQVRLGKLFKSLPEAEQRMLLEFAEFLASRAEATPLRIEDPKPIPRPEQESVIKAMRRLSTTYHMLDKSKMLNETSALMAQHVMQGRDAVEVIDELEVVFEAHYKRLVSENE
jgi:hypothetical protein